jgi:hypothetical protein
VNFQEAYQSRVTKIKISWQFVQICLRLNGTYRFPLPRLTIELLNYLKFLEFLDLVQIPMNMDCLRHVTYVEKLYMHTVLCCLVIASTVLVMQRRRFGRLEIGGGEDLTDNRSTDLDSKIEMSFRANENGISPHHHIQRIQRIYALKDGRYWQIDHF